MDIITPSPLRTGTTKTFAHKLLFLFLKTFKDVGQACHLFFDEDLKKCFTESFKEDNKTITWSKFKFFLSNS